MANRSRSSRSSFPARKVPEWANLFVTSRVLAGTAVATLGAVAEGITPSTKQTVARCRGEAMVVFDPGAAGDTMIVGLGLAVVTVNAFVVGGALAMPSPIDEPQSGVFLWHKLFMLGPVQGSSGDDRSVNGNDRIEIDAKAMRKMDPEDVLAFIWDARVLAGAPTYDSVASVRVLGLLS